MFHPGVTGSCGSRTQKHTSSATPMVSASVEKTHTFISIQYNKGQPGVSVNFT